MSARFEGLRPALHSPDAKRVSGLGLGVAPPLITLLAGSCDR